MAFSNEQLPQAANIKSINTRAEMSASEFTLVLDYIKEVKDDYDRNNILNSVCYLALSGIAGAIVRQNNANKQVDEMAENHSTWEKEGKTLTATQVANLVKQQEYAENIETELQGKIEFSSCILKTTPPEYWPTIESLNKMEATTFGEVPGKTERLTNALADCKSEFSKIGIYTLPSVKVAEFLAGLTGTHEYLRELVEQEAKREAETAAHAIQTAETTFEKIVIPLYDNKISGSLMSVLETDLAWHAERIFLELEDSIAFSTNKKRKTYVSKTKIFWQNKIDTYFELMGLIKPILDRNNNISDEFTTAHNIDHLEPI